MFVHRLHFQAFSLVLVEELFSRLSNFNPIHICSRSCIFHQTSAGRFSGYKYMTYHDVSVLGRFPISPEVILLFFFFPSTNFRFLTLLAYKILLYTSEKVKWKSRNVVGFVSLTGWWAVTNNESLPFWISLSLSAIVEIPLPALSSPVSCTPPPCPPNSNRSLKIMIMVVFFQIRLCLFILPRFVGNNPSLCLRSGVSPFSLNLFYLSYQRPRKNVLFVNSIRILDLKI